MKLLETIFQHHLPKYPNFLFVIEITLTTLFSSSIEERGFSTVNCIFPDNCLRLSKNALDSLMVIVLWLST